MKISLLSSASIIPTAATLTAPSAHAQSSCNAAHYSGSGDQTNAASFTCVQGPQQPN
jgi:hypothetical protein